MMRLVWGDEGQIEVIAVPQGRSPASGGACRSHFQASVPGAKSTLTRTCAIVIQWQPL